jgi:hypothetical protein
MHEMNLITFSQDDNPANGSSAMLPAQNRLLFDRLKIANTSVKDTLINTGKYGKRNQHKNF